MTPVSRETTELCDRILAQYPALGELPRAELLGDLSTTPAIRAPAGTRLFGEAEPCRGFPLVIDGEIRVSRTEPQGRELELYRVEPGEICVVSAGCLFGSMPMSAHGACARETELILVPEAMIMRWTDRPGPRRLLMGLFAERLADLMSLVEALAFHPLEKRLAAALLGHGPILGRTHQQLADELGVSREHMSRMLKRMERDGLIRLSREHIGLLDPAGLRKLAERPD